MVPKTYGLNAPQAGTRWVYDLDNEFPGRFSGMTYSQIQEICEEYGYW